MSEVLGLSFEGLKHMAWELFVELEKRAPTKPSNDSSREKTKKRELRNLQWGLMYNKGEAGEGQGSVRRLRGIRDCAP